MAGLDIPSGQLADHGSGVLPLDASGLPGVPPPTSVSGLLTPADQGGVAPTTEWNLQQQQQGTADAADAMAVAMDARDAMLDHYLGQALPLGGSIGDQPVIPPVPDTATPPAMSDLYPYAGQEPTPAGAGFNVYHGDLPE